MNKSKTNRIISILVVIVLLFNLFATDIYAFSISEIFDRGNNVTGSGNEYNEIENIIDEIGTGLVKPVGYLIFAIITVVLGVQYIWSGYNGKSKVKETLPTFICAVVFFYLAENVLDLVKGVIGYDTPISNFDTFTGNIWVNVCNVVQILAFAGILFIGVKYLLESSEGRAKIKEQLAPMLIGIVFVFCAANVVSYVVRIGDSLI